MATWGVIWDLSPKICQGEQLRVPGAEARLGREKKGSQRGSSEDGAVHFDQCLPLSRVGADRCPCVTLLRPTGEGLGCGTACGSHSCPEGFCSNGGRCHLHPSSCAPTCLCPPAFTDQRCLVAGGDFQPPASPGGCPCPVPCPSSASPGAQKAPRCFCPADLPRRSVRLQVRALQNATAGEVNASVRSWQGTGCHGGSGTGGMLQRGVPVPPAPRASPPVASPGIQQLLPVCSPLVPKAGTRPSSPRGWGTVPAALCSPPHTPRHRSRPSWARWR